MPNRQLTQQDNFETISKWLDENLPNPFPANLQHLPPNDNNRGIYFWFMRTDGYQRLSNFGLNITAITPTYKKEINGKQYDLVYLGTAGTGKKEKSNIINRLNWHLKNTHDEKHICSGFLSTLRQTVGAALSDDLINNDTGLLVNTLFSDLFYLYTLPYLGDSNTKLIIDEDEHCLISTIKPLFNIKNNPNARINAGQHPTRQLKVRRGLIMHNTRERIGCNKGNNGKAKAVENDNKPPSSPINNYEIISEYNGCIEFTVNKDQSVHEVISGIEGLPTGKCEILIYNSAKPSEFLYASQRKNGKRVTGDKKKTIYSYFNNIDTNKNNQPRWKLIQQEMLDKGIEEITLRVCSDKVDEEKVVESSTEKKRGRPSKNKTGHNALPALSKNEIIEKLTNRKKDSPVLLILGCSDSKSAGGEALQNNYFETDCITIKRQLTLNNYNESIENNPTEFNKKRNRIPVDANYFANCQNLYMEALDRYCTNRSIFYKPDQIELYRQKIAEGRLHILIISGLYGVIKWNDRIIDYHFEFNPNSSYYSEDLCILQNIEEYIRNNGIENENVFYCLNKKYVQLVQNNNQNWNLIEKEENDKWGHTAANIIRDSFLAIL